MTRRRELISNDIIRASLITAGILLIPLLMFLQEKIEPGRPLRPEPQPPAAPEIEKPKPPKRAASPPRVRPEPREPAPLTPGSVRVVNVRLDDWTNPAGRKLQQVAIEWENVGERPIRVFYGRVWAWDAAGQRVTTGIETRDYCLFACFNNSQGVRPGDVFRPGVGEGYSLLGPTRAALTEVEVTRVEEWGAY